MISNILPIAAFAGAALAACPLSVEIVGTTDHIAQVAVTNTGSETITLYKGNTVLSDHATKDLVVADAGKLNSAWMFHLELSTNLINRRNGSPI